LSSKENAMNEFTPIVGRYLEAFNETDPVKRRDLIEGVFTEDVSYTDPLGAVTGWDGIDGFIAGAQQQFGGLEFNLAGAVDGHHDIARFTWHLGDAVAIGFDVVVLENGKIRQVLGFLDKIPG
jgi:SnoaL-like domain